MTKSTNTEKLITVYHINQDLRVALRVIINRKSLDSLVQVYDSLTNGFRNIEPVERISDLYSISGHHVQTTEDLWGPSDIFIATSTRNIKWQDLQNVIQNILRGNNKNKSEKVGITKESNKKEHVEKLDDYEIKLKRHQRNLAQPLKSIMKKQSYDNSKDTSSWSIERPDTNVPRKMFEDIPREQNISPNLSPRFDLSKPLKLINTPQIYHQQPESTKVLLQDLISPTMPSVLPQYYEFPPEFEVSNNDYIMHHKFIETVSFADKYPEIEDNYKMIGLIGMGRFSRIYQGKQKRSNLDQVCLKVIRTDRLPTKTPEYTPLKEINLIKEMNHQNIIQIIDWIEIPSRLTVVLEFAPRGDLFQVLKLRGAFSEEHAFSVVKEISCALHYLHYEKLMVHRNVRLENILVFSINRYHIICKLTDFGLACLFDENGVTEVIGSIHYLAPEMLKEKKYSWQADIWALGVVTYILLSLIPPFFSFTNNIDEIKGKIIDHDYYFPRFLWNTIKPESICTIDYMLCPDPMNRPEAVDLICHPWIVLQTDPSYQQPLYNQTNFIKHYPQFSENELIHECDKRRRNILGQEFLPASIEKSEIKEEEPKSKARGIWEKIKDFFVTGEYETKFQPFIESGVITVPERKIRLGRKKPIKKQNYVDDLDF